MRAKVIVMTALLLSGCAAPQEGVVAQIANPLAEDGADAVTISLAGQSPITLGPDEMAARTKVIGLIRSMQPALLPPSRDLPVAAVVQLRRGGDLQEQIVLFDAAGDADASDARPAIIGRDVYRYVPSELAALREHLQAQQLFDAAP